MSRNAGPTCESLPVSGEDDSRSSDAVDLLIDAIVQVESLGNPGEVGRAGERGLMQIRRGTWNEITKKLFGRSISFDRAFEPGLNRRVGRAYLAELRGHLYNCRSAWRSDERSLLLACYNAGPGRVKRAGYDLDRLPRSTRNYIKRASALHDFYLAEERGVQLSRAASPVGHASGS